MIELARHENCWVELSGLYRFSQEQPPYRDMAPLLKAVCAVASDRVIWGSDWPNVALFDPARMPETGAKLDALGELLEDEALLRAVLVDNPRRLFGTP